MIKMRPASDFVKRISAALVFALLLYAFSGRTDIGIGAVTQSTYSEKNDNPKFSGSCSAQSCVLLDANTGEILFSKSKDLRLPMASTTKIMTALVALDHASLSDNVKITKSSVGIEGSSIYLSEGEIFTLEELLYGLMLESGNDAADAISRHVGGSPEKFVSMMNEKAKSLGLSGTHFTNPHGLSDEAHYTTAYELAVIMSYAMKNPDFRKISGTSVYKIEDRENCRARYFSNHNRLLRELDICTSGKTGYTIASGRCLVTCGESDGARFVAVTLNDRNDWRDHRELLSFACENYRGILAAKKGELVYFAKSDVYPYSKKALVNPEDIYITVPKNTVGELFIEAKIISHTDSPTGELTVKYGDYSSTFPLEYAGLQNQ